MSWPCAISDTSPEDMFNKQITQYLGTLSSQPQNCLPGGSLSCRARGKKNEPGMNVVGSRHEQVFLRGCCHVNTSSVKGFVCTYSNLISP